MTAGSSRRLDRELIEKAQVVLIEQANIVHAVLEHGQPFDADAERKPADLLRVIADRFEDGRMHHAAAENFEPAGLFADRTAATGAATARDVDLGARLGIRKEARA